MVPSPRPAPHDSAAQPPASANGHAVAAGSPVPALSLAPRPPFDAAPILAYLGRSPREPLDVVMDGAYRRAFRLDGRAVLIEVVPHGDVAAPGLTVRLLHADGAPSDDDRAALLMAAGREVARWWQIDQDASELEVIAARDPTFGALLGRLHGARQPIMPAPFECLVWAILGQQITLAFAYTLKRALVERYGETLAHGGRAYALFPRPEHLAAADPAELRALQLSRQKSDYIRTLAGLEAEGRIDWHAIVQQPAEAAISTLTALRGVGRWTAEYVLMRGLGHPDVIPAADVGLRSAIGAAYGFGRNATEAEVRALAEPWAPRRSHAAYAWWWSLAASRQPSAISHQPSAISHQPSAASPQSSASRQDPSRLPLALGRARGAGGEGQPAGGEGHPVQAAGVAP